MPVSSASSIATTLGIGSGVDMVGLANQLAEAQFAPRTQQLTDRSQKLERQISLAGSIRSALSQFASALGERVRTGDLSAQAQISNPAVARVSSPLGTSGKGSFSLEVTQLASGQTLSSGSFVGASAPTGAGTLAIRFGATTVSGFSENLARPAVAIDVAPGATLSDVAAAINGKKAGLSAYVATTATGAQLVVKGPDGKDNGFIIEATEDPAQPGLSALAWAPGSAPTRLIATSQNAEYKLDGIARTSPTNSVAAAAPGLDLTITATNPGAPATISFSQPQASIATAMQDLVGALNEVAGLLKDATDPLTGELARDTGARGLSRRLSALGSQVIMPNAPAGTPRTLTELGLATERDGKFRFEANKLTEAMNRDPEAVAAMFTNGINGVFAEIDKLSRSTTVGSDPGTLGGSIARYQTQSTKITRDLADLSEQKEKLRQVMVANFSKADSRVAASKSTLSFLQSQIDVWNAQRN